jgi:hypothetical protein
LLLEGYFIFFEGIKNGSLLGDRNLPLITVHGGDFLALSYNFLEQTFDDQLVPVDVGT